MIQYTLKCRNGHSFDSWFQSAAAFEKLLCQGFVSCSVCGSSGVEKAVMAPRVTTSKKVQQKAPQLTAHSDPTQNALKKLRTYIEKNSEYVGEDFAKEARAMHEGSSPERSIYGETKQDEAKELIKEGIPVTPLPFMSNRKTN